MVVTRRNLRVSKLAFARPLDFLVLHVIGAHDTYGEVQWRARLRSRGTGVDSAGRNHCDRFVHINYRLLLFRAVRKLFAARGNPRRIWRRLFAIGHSVVCETVEWPALDRFGGDPGAAHVGTRGEARDALKDMALASSGALGQVLTLVSGRAKNFA